MLRGAGLLGGQTNSAKGILGPTRELYGYNYSLPPYTDLSLPVSTGRFRSHSRFRSCVSGDIQTLDFEGAGRDGIGMILFL
jgi:hypothetical protein